MISKDIVFKRKGEEKRISVMLPEALQEAVAVQGEQYVVEAVQEKMISDAKSAALGRKKRQRVLKLRLSDLPPESLSALQSLGLL